MNFEQRNHSPGVEQKDQQRYRPEQVAEISFAYLKEMLTSPKFYEKLDEMIMMGEVSKGYEIGFSILKHPETNETWYSEPVGSSAGDPEQADIYKSEARLAKKIQRLRGITPAVIANLHFHLSAQETFALTPSGLDGDLDALSKLRKKNAKGLGYDIMPLEIVLTRSLVDNEFFVIICRESSDFSMGDKRAMMRELDVSLMDTNDQQEVFSLFDHYKYKIAFFKTQKHRFAPQDLNQLNDFAYVPKKVGQQAGFK